MNITLTIIIVAVVAVLAIGFVLYHLWVMRKENKQILKEHTEFKKALKSLIEFYQKQLPKK